MRDKQLPARQHIREFLGDTMKEIPNIEKDQQDRAEKKMEKEEKLMADSTDEAWYAKTGNLLGGIKEKPDKGKTREWQKEKKKREKQLRADPDDVVGDERYLSSVDAH